MELTSQRYYNYIKVLKSELVPAMGCTEPISLAYCASKASELFIGECKKVNIYVSCNILKNVKSVVVPNTNGGRGIKTAVASGIIAKDSSKKLEVLSILSNSDIEKIEEFKKNVCMEIFPIDEGHIFDIIVEMIGDEHSSSVRIVDTHTNIVECKVDGVKLAQDPSTCQEIAPQNEDVKKFIETITIEEICDFANKCDINDIKDIIDKQIEYNMAISLEGMKNSYGANIGKVLLQTYGDSTYIKARAYAASASDARMNGCDLPVVIVSGSGNQGLTTSIPVIIYHKDLGLEKEKLYRALVLANLTTIHLKAGIGRLSAYCGAVAAGCGAASGVCYLHGGDFKAISHTIVNAIAINSGIVCDGAKASCAAKISSSVDAGLLGYFMYKNGNQFKDGDGIVKKGVENTIHNVGILASKGMCETDKEIIKIMLD